MHSMEQVATMIRLGVVNLIRLGVDLFEGLVHLSLEEKPNKGYPNKGWSQMDLGAYTTSQQTCS